MSTHLTYRLIHCFGGQVTFDMLESASSVQPNLLHLSDKHPHSCDALGSVPAEVRSGPAALRLQSLLKVSVECQELKIVSFFLYYLILFFLPPTL